MIKDIRIQTFIIMLFLICCKIANSDDNSYSLIIGDWKEIKEINLNCNDANFYEMNDGGYTFRADKTVDMKKAFYELSKKDKEGGDSLVYKGMFAKYEIIHNTLKIQNPKDLTWYNRKIISLSKDTMILAGRLCSEKFVRVNYNLDTTLDYDKIILSTSYPPLGKFPVFDIMICSNGEVVYLGEDFSDTKGFYTSKISVLEYQMMQDNFRKVDIKNVKSNNLISIDQQERYTTFVKEDKIFRTCNGYEPMELYWATIPLENLDKTESLLKLSESDSAFYFSNPFFQYKVGNKVMDIEKSESFLLWNYLRKGKWATKSFKKRFELAFNGYYICQPTHNSIEKYKVKKIETDGQFYKLYMIGKLPITIDIGHNFVDNNFSKLNFKEKKEFD